MAAKKGTAGVVKLGAKAAGAVKKAGVVAKVVQRAGNAYSVVKNSKFVLKAGNLIRGGAKLGLACATGYSAWNSIKQAGMHMGRGECFKAARCMVNLAGAAQSLTRARKCKSNVSSVDEMSGIKVGYIIEREFGGKGREKRLFYEYFSHNLYSCWEWKEFNTPEGV